MASPFEYDLGNSQGRIQPVNAVPVRTTASRDSGIQTYNLAGLLPGTLAVRINGGALQTITISAGDVAVAAAATAAEIVAALNTGGAAGAANALAGATASVTTDLRVRILTNTAGETGSVEIDAGGTLEAALGFAVGATTGTGGNFLFCLGSDRLPAPVFDIDIGNDTTVRQGWDWTGTRIIRATLRLRQPAGMPTPLNLVTAAAPGTLSLQNGGIFATSTLHARLAIGAGDSQVRYFARAVGAAGTTIRVAHVNPGVINSPLAVLVAGQDITVRLATDGAGALTSTADQVAVAVRAEVAAQSLVYADAARPGAGVAAVLALTLLALSDDALDALVSTVDVFTQAHVGRLLRIAGSVAGNNGDYLIVSVLDARTAVLSSAVTDEAAGFSANLIGALWELIIFTDIGGNVLLYRQERGRDVVRTDLAVNVSKVNAVQAIGYMMRLVEDP